MTGACFAEVHESLPTVNFKLHRHICLHQFVVISTLKHIMLVAFDTGQPHALYPHRRMCYEGRLQLQVYIKKYL